MYPEVALWNQLKAGQIGFDINRQFRRSGYISDFYCRRLKVAIEIDGKVHGLKLRQDELRDAWLLRRGISVIRFSACAVLNSPEAVALEIKAYLENRQADFETKNRRKIED